LNIVIADIHFLMSCRDMPVNPETYSKTYGPFITETISSGEGSVNIDLGIDINTFPDIRKMTKIFDTLELWSMFSSGNEYFWVDAVESSPRESACIASFQRKPERVAVYCRDRLISETDGQRMIDNPFVHPLDQLLMMYALAERDGAILHACAVELDGKGLLLPGKSGAGKTTISRLFAARGHTLLSDDRVVARKIKNDFYAFGTPWAGDAGIAENRKLPLKGIFFIRQSSGNRIEKITAATAAERLMPMASIPWFDEKTMPAILSFCEDLILHVPAYELFFKPDTEVVDVLEKFISE
jgi:hypothetical protein